MSQLNGHHPSPPSHSSSTSPQTYNDHFTISNIPFGVVSTPENPTPQIATRLYGDVFLIPKLLEHGLLGEVEGEVRAALLEPNLTHFASLGRPTHRLIRQKLQSLLRNHLSQTTSTSTNPTSSLLHSCSHPISSCTTHLPLLSPDFSDFSCSTHHVLNAGEAVMGIRKLPPGFPYFPVGYAGRSSSIVVSGTGVRRPRGQYRVRKGGDGKGGDEVVFGESKAVDFELEVGVVVGRGTGLGESVNVGGAEECIFGFVLVNDWSARDIQSLEMSPLGPFQGKSFATTISPWIITIDALEPFRCAGPQRDPSITLAPYLQDVEPAQASFEVKLQAVLDTSASPSSTSASATESSTTLTTTSLSSLYWTPRDILAHQTVNGCPLSPGDLLATGTISGSEPGSHGCLLEITRGGKQEVRLKNGEGRVYLEDGDGVVITGWAGERGGEGCVGFGDCAGMIRGWSI